MGRPRASLTFDDGPHRQTPELLGVLERHHVPATFFQCGAYVRARPEIARAVAVRNEIGNHTDTHPWLWRCSPSTIQREISRAQEAIVEATEVTPRWFRAPYGIPGLGLSAALHRVGLRSIRWTVIAQDWKLPARAIADRVLRRVHPGANICLHDGRDINPNPNIRETIEAVRIIVPELLERGYELVTLTDLLCPKTTLPDA